MSRVKVTGTVLEGDDSLKMGPTVPGENPPVSISIEGDSLPPVGSRASCTGEIGPDQKLTVTSWESEGIETSSMSLPSGPGIPMSEVAEISREFAHSDLPVIGFGVSKVGEDNGVLTVEVKERTPELDEWLASKPTEAIRLLSFIEHI